MKNDIIIRPSEVGMEFYFIKKGSVEIIASDGKTVNKFCHIKLSLQKN